MLRLDKKKQVIFVSFPLVIQIPTSRKAGSWCQRALLPARRMPGLMQACLLLLIVMGLSSCERAGTLLAEPQYQAALVGDWQGAVGDDSETISFKTDGRFRAKLRSNGFISSTLGQGATGTLDGTWALQGNVITLAIDQASSEPPLNLATDSTIVSFHQNQWVVKSNDGETSIFNRTP
jgi:hypothetical protein